jgi:hypothetical protein
MLERLLSWLGAAAKWKRVLFWLVAITLVVVLNVLLRPLPWWLT